MRTVSGVDILPRSFYDRDTRQVALDLLGLHLVVGEGGEQKIARIVEVEAYLGSQDLACHTSRGMTRRTQVMFGPPGHAYVYLIYGMYHCLNVVTEPEGKGCAVLIRAVEIVSGFTGKTSGPGLLCRALGIGMSHNGVDLTQPKFCLVRPATAGAIRVVRRPRIGVDYAGHWAKRLLRFYIKESPCISRR